jgi:large repetitive protein
MRGYNMQKLIHHLMRCALRYALLISASAFSYLAIAHSVGQVQTTKFLAPETVSMLEAKYDSGSNSNPGFQVGDIVSYIIQFTPVQNDATVGVAGYITDYIPPGVVVVGADMVNVDANGNFYVVPPKFPGGIDFGWGDRGAVTTFLAPFNTAAYDTTGSCTAAGYTSGNCDARINQLYADTGIFYSTDPLTAVYPPLPARIAQGTNGYNINPTSAGKLNAILAQSQATTHNLWDANQSNAFGAGTQAIVTAIVSPKSPDLYLGNSGAGPTPYRAGSAVAGPQTGYTLDNTGLVGPWQRIAYAGSRIGDPTTGPATAPDISDTAVGGMATSLGYSLSEANPLPAGTNAVRWAVGKLVVGQISYVRIKLKITQPVPSGGILNSAEVFGGDAGDSGGVKANGALAAGGQDNVWRYHVPSVADSNSNLYIRKIACVYDPTATACVPLPTAYTVADTTITYKITYLNTGNSVQNNVVLKDILPCQTSTAVTFIKVGAVTGPLSSLSPLASLPYTTNTTANGSCTAGSVVRQTITFPTISSLGLPGSASAGGNMIINVRNNATSIIDPVVNTANLSSTALPAGVTSNAVTFIGDSTRPALTISKTSPATTSTAGGTAQYTIVVKNVGTGAAGTVTIADILPTMGGNTANAATRFNYASTVSVTSTGLTTSTALVTSTNTSALFTPIITPYDTAVGATNTVQIRWSFGAASSLAVGGVITITFNVSIGASVAGTATPYYNNAVAIAGTDFADPIYRIDANSSAPITVQGALSVSKTLECYFVGTTCAPANASNTIPPNSQVRYRVDYANIGSSTLTNVVLTDTLPCQINSTIAPTPTVTITAVVSGPIGVSTTIPYGLNTSSGNCPNTRPVLSLPAVTLNAGQTGSLKMDVKLTTPSTTSTVVVNDVTLSNGSITSNAQSQLADH